MFPSRLLRKERLSDLSLKNTGGRFIYVSSRKCSTSATEVFECGNTGIAKRSLRAARSMLLDVDAFTAAR